VDRESVYIRRIIDGDVAPFSWFVETYKDMAFSIACHILGNNQDAEEVVQDAFLQAFRSIRSFKGRSKFSTWLYRIVVNGSLNRLKKKKLETSYEDVELAQECVEDVESCYRQLTMQDQTKFINQALARLRAEDRLILTLYYLDEQSLGEVGDIMGIAKENMKMKLHRARAKMYGVLSKLLNMDVNNL
jgi:RNA polymerase sigma factor (sigma-70 family)